MIDQLYLILLCLTGIAVACAGVLAAIASLAAPAFSERSNCLLYAWRQHRRYGWHIVVSASQHGWWLHFRATPDYRCFFEFHPVARKRKRLLPPLLFRGYVREVTL